MFTPLTEGTPSCLNFSQNGMLHLDKTRSGPWHNANSRVTRLSGVCGPPIPNVRQRMRVYRVGATLARSLLAITGKKWESKRGLSSTRERHLRLCRDDNVNRSEKQVQGRRRRARKSVGAPPARSF